jgi:DNA-binding MurR/RpiR family transcriptional regulator
MQVKDLSVEDFKFLIQETVTETVQSLLNDPDVDKQLKTEVSQSLADSLQQTRNGERGISAEEVAQRLGLDW